MGENDVAGKMRGPLAAMMLAAAVVAPATVHAQAATTADSEVVVTGMRSKLSNWRQAETSHVARRLGHTEQFEEAGLRSARPKLMYTSRRGRRSKW